MAGCTLLLSLTVQGRRAILTYSSKALLLACRVNLADIIGVCSRLQSRRHKFAPCAIVVVPVVLRIGNPEKASVVSLLCPLRLFPWHIAYHCCLCDVHALSAV